MKINSNSPGDTFNIGRLIARYLNKGDIVCLYGELGSGKTVLTKGIASGLGIKRDSVISPTFVLMRQHQGRIALYHFDLYRAKGPQDVLNLGYEEYFYDEGVAIIEWADRLNSLLPEHYLGIKLSVKGDKKRLLSFTPVGGRYQDLMEKVNESR